VQDTSPSSTATPTVGTTEGYVASLKFACGGKNKDGDPSEKIATVAYNFHSDSAKRLVMMYSIMDL
jgi:hypothetical protein